MVLDTSADVDSIDSVLDRDGAVLPAANADEQKRIVEAVSNATSADTLVVQPDVAGQALPSLDVARGSAILVYADPANTGPILVGGDSGATIPLPKETGMTWEVDNAAALRAKAQNAGDTLHVGVVQGGGT